MGVLESPGKVLDFFVSKRVRTLSYTVDVSVSVNNVRTIGCILMNFQYETLINQLTLFIVNRNMCCRRNLTGLFNHQLSNGASVTSGL